MIYNESRFHQILIETVEMFLTKQLGQLAACNFLQQQLAGC